MHPFVGVYLSEIYVFLTKQLNQELIAMWQKSWTQLTLAFRLHFLPSLVSHPNTLTYTGIIWCRTWICSFCSFQVQRRQLISDVEILTRTPIFNVIVYNYKACFLNKTSSRLIFVILSSSNFKLRLRLMRCINYANVKQNTMCLYYTEHIACNSSSVFSVCADSPLCRFAFAIFFRVVKN